MIDRVAVVVNLYGSAPSIFTVSGDKVAASTRTAPVIQPEKRIGIFRPAGTPLLVLSASLKELERLLGEIAGIHPARLDFEPGLNLESPEGRRLQRLISFSLGELSANPRALDNTILRRMERARRRLPAPTPGTTVTRVSLDCGSTTLSRFAQEYRRLFGETPSMSLNRSR